jgi:replicative DNA helicase
MSERKLPHSLEAEQSLLGAILVDCEAASGALQLVTANDFYSPRHARIFCAIQEIFDRNATVDEVLLLAELERRGEAEAAGGIDYIDELVDRLPAAANAEYYARIVHEKAILRALHGTCSEIVQGVYDSDTPAQEQLEQAEQKIFEIGQRGAGQEFVPIHEIIDQQFEKLESRDAANDAIFSGFSDLDRTTTGFHAAEFIIVAGRPSMGKTSFCMNVIEHAALSGRTVAIFSLEVSREQLVQNLLCAFARVDAQRLRNRSLSNADWQDLINGASKLRQARIFIDDSPGLTPLALKSKARRLHKRGPLDIIVIDYLQLMEHSGGESRQQEISTISRSLKALARELHVPVIAISQLSRSVENRESHRPRMSDLRESGAIEQDADLVLLLYREEYYHPDRESAKGQAEVIIAKQRHGPTGSVKLAFLSQFMRFENLALRDKEF